MKHAASWQLWPVYLALGLLVVVAVAFVIEFVSSSTTPAPENLPLVTDPYSATVTPLLEAADPAHGAALIEQYGCVVCHRLGAENHIAPSFAGIAERASTRRQSWSAADYLYESITDPQAYVVEGYTPAMPQDFRSRLSDRDLGDIIAYLLTPDAH